MLIRVIVAMLIVCFIGMALSLNYFETMKQSLHNYIIDTNYNVPIEYRKPKLHIREFLNTREQIKTDQMIETRAMFSKQPFVGSIILGGYHSLLGLNAKWLNNMVTFGYREEIEKLVST
jgi:cell division protein YceG involved in septum cleavage